MAKVYLKVEMRVIVDTDLNDVNDIMDCIDIDATTCVDEDVLLLEDCEVTNTIVEDAK